MLKKHMLKEVYLLAVMIVAAQQGCLSGISSPTNTDHKTSSTRDEYARFTNILDRGESKLTEKDFEGAKQAFEEANIIAKEHKWVNETVSSTIGMGEAAVGKGNLSLATELYKEAVRVCETESTCTIEQLDVAVSFLNRLYLFQLRDPASAVNLLVQVDSGVKCSAGVCDDFVCAQWKRIYAASDKTLHMPDKCSR